MYKSVNVSVAICTPVPQLKTPAGSKLAPVSSEWHRARIALGMPSNFNHVEIRADRMEVGDARNYAVDVALNHSSPIEFIFFIDYDVLIPPNALARLLSLARWNLDADIFSGLYCTKSATPEPLVYRELGEGAYWDWALGDLLSTARSGVKYVGMGCTLIRMSVFRELGTPYFQTVNETDMKGGVPRSVRGTEDIYFCHKVDELRGGDPTKHQVMVDTGLLCGHIDVNGVTFGLPPESLPIKKAKWLGVGKDPVQVPDMPKLADKLALDVGCGENKVKLAGFEVHGLDLRPVGGVDFVQDSREMTLHDDTYDIVYSSHHLEHIGRQDQLLVLGNMYRVLKPGCKVEIHVPNIEWAAAKIVAGEVDVDVFNVLYGAQEVHGYDRNLNTHFCGYTPDLLKFVLEKTGFVDVSVTGYKDDPAMSYELVAVATKPGLDVGASESDEKPQEEERPVFAAPAHVTFGETSQTYPVESLEFVPTKTPPPESQEQLQYDFSKREY